MIGLGLGSSCFGGGEADNDVQPLEGGEDIWGRERELEMSSLHFSGSLGLGGLGAECAEAIEKDEIACRRCVNSVAAEGEGLETGLEVADDDAEDGLRWGTAIVFTVTRLAADELDAVGSIDKSGVA